MEIPAAALKGFLDDDGYDGDRSSENLLIRGILLIIASRWSRVVPKYPDYRCYRNRDNVERISGKFKQQCRLATLYDNNHLVLRERTQPCRYCRCIKFFVNTEREKRRREFAISAPSGFRRAKRRTLTPCDSLIDPIPQERYFSPFRLQPG